MRDFDDIGFSLCKIQARIFESSITKASCSSLIFMRRFMNSQVAERFDRIGFLFESCSDDKVFDQIIEEYGETSYGKEKYTPNELHWIGYIYRYWAYTYEKTSKQLYRLVKPKELRDLYYPYHSLDHANAIERIMEAKGIKEYTEGEMIQRGVEILRRLIKEREAKK